MIPKKYADLDLEKLQKADSDLEVFKTPYEAFQKETGLDVNTLLRSEG